MSKVFSSAAVLLFLMITTAYFAEAGPRSQSRVDSCREIAELYSQCGRTVDFDGQNFHFTHSPSPVSCDDGRDLGFYDRIDSMDMASIFMFPYQPGVTPLPETRLNWDPGRLRSEDLFKFVYGIDESATRANLVRVSFLNQTVLFQKELGAASALTEVSRELLLAAKSDSALARFLLPFTSKKVDLRYYVYDWRLIKGSTRLSTHAFGTAIDLLLDDGPQYWLWEEMKTHPAKANLGEDAYRDDHYIPESAPLFNAKAVAIFEKNGFIWGGKWNHFDTMHFEYRPEMLGLTSLNCVSDSPDLGLEFAPPKPEDFLFIRNSETTRPE